mmetsp:Transcript_127076/g.220194  ORF Transcript_127076/g.220194 Transcript_127076/m.220194 type:complete len:261 (+) Transcript_127076:584-1366(+)
MPAAMLKACRRRSSIDTQGCCQNEEACMMELPIAACKCFRESGSCSSASSLRWNSVRFSSSSKPKISSAKLKHGNRAPRKTMLHCSIRKSGSCGGRAGTWRRRQQKGHCVNTSRRPARLTSDTDSGAMLSVTLFSAPPLMLPWRRNCSCTCPPAACTKRSGIFLKVVVSISTSRNCHTGANSGSTMLAIPMQAKMGKVQRMPITVAEDACKVCNPPVRRLPTFKCQAISSNDPATAARAMTPATHNVAVASIRCGSRTMP